MEQKKVFIAHANEDKPLVRSLFTVLKGANFDVWMDEHSISPGEHWKSSIAKAISSSDFFLACISANLIDKTGVVQQEFRYALNEAEKYPLTNNKIVPVSLDGTAIPDSPIGNLNLRDFHGVDLTVNGTLENLIHQIRSSNSKTKQSTPAFDPNKLKTRLGQGKIQEVLNSLDTITIYSDNEANGTVKIIMAQYRTLCQDINRGQISYETQRMEHAKLIRSILMVIESMSTESIKANGRAL